MKALKIVLWTLYRIWFYLLVLIPIIVFFPFLLIAILKEHWYPYFFVMMRIWAKFILVGMGFRVKGDYGQEIKQGKSYMLVANHTSMIDIMLMISVVKTPFVFVGKKELSKIPVFGFFYKRTCIMVDRKCSKSRSGVFKRAQKRLHQGLSICIFPEGGVPHEEVVLDEFKDGAFRLAIDHQIPIVPFTFCEVKKRFPFRFFAGSPGGIRVYQHPKVLTKGLTQNDKLHLKDQIRETILSKL